MEKEPNFFLSSDATVKNDLTVVNFPSTLKLTSTNYLGWKTQIEALLHGLDLYRFIDGTHPPPTPTIAEDGTSTPTPTTLIGSGKISFFSVLLLAAFPLKSFLL
ncbi:hypothetical protein LXL04_014912 [Taraxacum kok-saghyz]